MRKVAALMVAWLLMASAGWAETVRPRIELGSRLFASYFYDFSWYDRDADPRSASNGMNAFELDFAELYLQGWASRSLSAEVRIEARRVQSYTIETEDGETQRVYPDNWGDFQMIMKLGYIYGHILPAFNVRAGLIGMPWIAEEEVAWRYRFVEDTLEMRGSIAWHEADIGLELFGAFPNQYGRYSAGVVNGEGYRQQEDNKYKAGFAMVRLAPFAAFDNARGLTVSAAGRYEVEGDPSGNAYDAVLTGSGILNYQWPDAFSIGVEGIYEAQIVDENWNTAESMVGSIFGSARLVDRLWLIGRFDAYDFNIAQSSSKTSARTSRINDEQLDSDEDAEILALAGLAFEIAPPFRVALSYRIRFWEQTYPDGTQKGDTIAPEQIGKASLEFGF